MSNPVDNLPAGQKSVHIAHYPGQGQGDMVRLVHYPKDHSVEYEMARNVAVFVCEGVIELRLDDKKTTISAGNLIFIPADSRVKVTGVPQAATIMVVQLPLEKYWHDMGLNTLREYKDKVDGGFHILESNPLINSYMDSTANFLRAGFDTPKYLETKVTEFIHVVKGAYTFQEQAAFYYPVLGYDINFIDFVNRNIHKVKTVGEFATLAKMSRTGFIDKFRRKTGQNPTTYLKNHRLALIRNDIATSDLSLKEVALKYGYVNYDVFSKICKKHFGSSPSEIRRAARIIFRNNS